MKTIHVAIQASSTSWTGGKDICMNFIDGHPVIYWTIKNILDNIENASVTIIAPEFDKDGDFNAVVDQFKGKNVKISYSHNDSPLDRFISCYEQLQNDEAVNRVDGLNFAFYPEGMKQMHSMVQENKFDIVKYPDDFPIHFTSDAYKIGALRKVQQLLKVEDAIYKVHPKYYMIMHPESFKAGYFEPSTVYSDELLTKYRNSYRNVFAARQGGIKHRISAGDQLNFHYEIAAEKANNKMEVLDIASGEGFGSRILAEKANLVIGADYDETTIENAKTLHKDVKNLKFSVENALGTTFKDNSFDLITSMETIEHVPNEDSFMVEMKRILKSGGYFIFSTPQNSMGHIPMNNEHIKEYSLDEVIGLAKKYFTIERIIGIKQGRIIIPDSHKGTNTMVICRK
jgi:2-polyprenyl-3-methyl-5-hydroxy-6-metoxy-1,4-benzoquinol methylase